MYIVIEYCYHVTTWHAFLHHVTECKSKSFGFPVPVQTLFQKIGAADRRTALAGALSFVFVFSLPVEVKVKVKVIRHRIGQTLAKI